MFGGLVILAQAIFSITPQGASYGNYEVDYLTTLDAPPPLLSLATIPPEIKPLQFRLKNPQTGELYGPYDLRTGTSLGNYVIKIDYGATFFLQKTLFEQGLGPFTATNGAIMVADGAIPERMIVTEPAAFRVVWDYPPRRSGDKFNLGVLPADARASAGLRALRDNLIQINNIKKIDLAPRYYPDAPVISWSARDRFGGTPFYGSRGNVVTPSPQSQAENTERAAFLAQSQIELFAKNYCSQRSATMGQELSFTPEQGEYILLAWCRDNAGQTILWLTPFSTSANYHTTLHLNLTNARTWDTLFY